MTQMLVKSMTKKVQALDNYSWQLAETEFRLTKESQKKIYLQKL